jgi:hypothetical protein
MSPDRRSTLASTKILSDIGELDCHRRLDIPRFEFRPCDGLMDISERFEADHVLTLSERRAFAL